MSTAVGELMSDSKSPRTEADSSLVIAIDGPAGVGKSTAARALAQRLGWDFLDTGALYRCVTLAVLRAGIPATDSSQVAQLARSLEIHQQAQRVWLGGTTDAHEVTQEIRQPEVSAAIGPVADNPHVRELLTQFQRDWVRGRHVVSEGRDQGTEVFLDSPCKIFLTATEEERARRRQADLAARGIDTPLEQVLRDQRERDENDRQRPIGGLRQAPDAVPLVTDGLSISEVVDRLAEIVHGKLAGMARSPFAKPPTSSVSRV
jgi:CMP/dCMP kinase